MAPKTRSCLCSGFLDVWVLTYAAWGAGRYLVTSLLWVLLPLAAYGIVAVLWYYHLAGIYRCCFILLKPGFPCVRAADH